MEPKQLENIKEDDTRETAADEMEETSNIKFIGRGDTVTQLTNFLKKDFGKKATVLVDKKLTVISISGPGGVGKTSLLEHCLRTGSEIIKTEGYLVLRVKGLNEKAETSRPRTLADIITSDLISSFRDFSKTKGITREIPRFKHLKKCRLELERLAVLDHEDMSKALKKEGKELDGVVVESFKKILDAGIGYIFSDKSKLKTQLSKTISDGKLVEKALSFVKEHTRNYEPSYIFGLLFSPSLRARLKANANLVLAESLSKDLDDLLQDKGPGDTRSFRQLLLIIDDYESLNEIMDDFMTQDLMPKLQQASYNSTIVVIGRQALTDTSEHWGEIVEATVTGDVCRVVLDRFSQEDAEAYINSRGIKDKKKVAEIIKKTKSYPYLLACLVDYETQGISIKALKKFFQRTTRWMNSQQKEWLKHLCYLDVIDETSIASIFGDEAASSIMEWLENEPSISDLSNEQIRILDIISWSIKDYIKRKSPKRHLELEKKAKVAMKASEDIRKEVNQADENSISEPKTSA